MTSHSFLHFFHAWSTINGTWQLRLLVLPLVPYSPRIQVGGKPPTKSMVLIFLHFFNIFETRGLLLPAPEGSDFSISFMFQLCNHTTPGIQLVGERPKSLVNDREFFFKGENYTWSTITLAPGRFNLLLFPFLFLLISFFILYSCTFLCFKVVLILLVIYSCSWCIPWQFCGSSFIFRKHPPGWRNVLIPAKGFSLPKNFRCFPRNRVGGGHFRGYSTC